MNKIYKVVKITAQLIVIVVIIVFLYFLIRDNSDVFSVCAERDALNTALMSMFIASTLLFLFSGSLCIWAGFRIWQGDEKFFRNKRFEKGLELQLSSIVVLLLGVSILSTGAIHIWENICNFF